MSGQNPEEVMQGSFSELSLKKALIPQLLLLGIIPEATQAVEYLKDHKVGKSRLSQLLQVYVYSAG